MFRKLTVFALATVIAIGALLGMGGASSDGRGQTAVAQEARLREGDLVPAAKAQLISQPGLYGLGPELPGSRYAVVEGRLVRLDAKTYKILSILRQDGAAPR